MGMFMNCQKLVQILLLALITISCMITLVQGQTLKILASMKTQNLFGSKTFQSHVENFKNGKEWPSEHSQTPEWTGSEGEPSNSN